MASRKHRIPVFSSDGRYCVKHLPLKAILSQVESGSIIPHRQTGQWRVVGFLDDPPSSSHSSPATISWMETRAYVGEFGPRAQAIAKNKIDSWKHTHDTKAVCISAGRVIRPEDANASPPPTSTLHSDVSSKGRRSGLVGSGK